MMKYDVKWFLVVLMLGTCPLALQAIDIRVEMEALADSARKILGRKQLPVVNARWMKLAQELNDTAQINDAYNNLTLHYYQLGNIDTLKSVTYKYMDWCVAYNRPKDRYTAWRQYIQRMTEKGMQEEAMAETDKLYEDAKKGKDRYGLACAEMCIGYNHRVFGNNVELCIECYNNALELFVEGEYYRDAYVVLLNISQTYLSRSDYAEAEVYLAKLAQLEENMREENIETDASLHLRFCEFRVISLLASKGRKVAEPYMMETDRFYKENPESSTPEAWFGYKIMCCRVLGDLKGNIAYVDSLMNYQRSLGICYPYNFYMKAQLQEQLGDYRSASDSYRTYASVSDSMRTAELDDKLSEYTAQYEVDRLKMEKLELSGKLTRGRLVMALIAGGVVLLLLLMITYLYIRTLSMNRKLEAARMAVHKMGEVKSSFIRHITHEIRTPLNSIVGFSTLLAREEPDEEEKKEYAAQVESNNTYLLGLMENILTVADMDSQMIDMSWEPVNVDNCCKECVDELHSALKPGVRLECIPSGISTVYAARPWMKIVLTALLDNAVKFTERGYIRVSCKEDKSRRVVCFVVEDTGIGLKQEEAEHIFERFYKVDTFTKGSGLGLAIAHEIMAMIGGRVYWDSTYQGGCRFVMEWPVQDKP